MLDYVALTILIVAALILFYGIIVIHDIPYEIAEHRKHPHADAIHIAGWVSLLTLHVLWPFLWIWATLYREDRGWGFKKGAQVGAAESVEQQAKIDALTEKVQQLEAQMNALNNHANSEEA